MRGARVLNEENVGLCQCGKYEELNNKGQCPECELHDADEMNRLDSLHRMLEHLQRNDPAHLGPWIARYREDHGDGDDEVFEQYEFRCVNCGVLLKPHELSPTIGGSECFNCQRDATDVDHELLDELMYASIATAPGEKFRPIL